MLPILLWEIAWKTIWLLVVALPALAAGAINAETQELAWQIVWVVLVYAAVPWGHVRVMLRHGSAGSSRRLRWPARGYAVRPHPGVLVRRVALARGTWPTPRVVRGITTGVRRSGGSGRAGGRRRAARRTPGRGRCGRGR